MATETMLEDSGIDAVIVILTPQAMTRSTGQRTKVIHFRGNTDKTIICSFYGRGLSRCTGEQVAEGRHPQYPYPDQAMLILAGCTSGFSTRSGPAVRPVRFPGRPRPGQKHLQSYEEKGTIAGRDQ